MPLSCRCRQALISVMPPLPYVVAALPAVIDDITLSPHTLLIFAC